MLLKDQDEEGRRELFTLVMTKPDDRLTGDEEIDSLPMPSWWTGEKAAFEEGQKTISQLSSLRPAEAD